MPAVTRAVRDDFNTEAENVGSMMPQLSITMVSITPPDI